MKKILFALVGVLIWGIANATSTPQGVSWVVGTTVSSTPVTIATASGSTYFLDFGDKIINANASGVTGAVIITNGGVTMDNSSPAPGSGGWSILTGWAYPAPVTALGGSIVLTDVSGIGIQYQFKIWNGTSRVNRPQ